MSVKVGKFKETEITYYCGVDVLNFPIYIKHTIKSQKKYTFKNFRSNGNNIQ